MLLCSVVTVPAVGPLSITTVECKFVDDFDKSSPVWWVEMVVAAMQRDVGRSGGDR